MWLVILKISISLLVVLALAEISKRVNPILGGLLNGLPLGTGLSVCFISYQFGIDYIIQGIPWGIAGLASSLLFCLAYIITGRLINNNIWSMIIASISGMISFFISGYLIFLLKLNLWMSLLFFLTFFAMNILIMNRLKINIKKSNPKPMSFNLLVVRGIVVGMILAATTGIASMAGSRWAGILSSFPSTLFALILALHFEERSNLYPAVILGFSYGISTLALFYTLCSYLLPIVGLNIGFLIIYCISIIYLYIFNTVIRPVQ